MKDFYIGYLPKMPASVAKHVRAAVITILVVSALLAAVFAFGQRPFAPAFFEFGNVKDFEGTIQSSPIPFLIVENSERTNGLPGLERIALVGEGKFGAFDAVKDFEGRRVRLRGTLIFRGDIRMIEVAEGTVTAAAGGGRDERQTEEDLGEMRLKGEIIDSKCYLGVMNPGNHKTHRSCAVACLRGGIPAMFLVKDENGNSSELWLLSEKGEPVNDLVLDYVAEPVELRGRVVRKGDSLFFNAEVASIRRL